MTTTERERAEMRAPRWDALVTTCGSPRNAAICCCIGEGATYDELAEVFSLSKSRLRHIVYESLARYESEEGDSDA